MSNAVCIVPRTNVGEMLKAVGLPTKSTPGTGVELVREIITVIEGLVATSISQQTSQSFIRARNEVFPKYASAIMSLGALASIVLSKQSVNQMSLDSFSAMEADFRDRGVEVLGADLSERGTFTVWTLRKIHELAKEIAEAPACVDSEQDRENAMQFVYMALWNRYHVDCLTKAIRTKQPIQPELAEPIQEGLRAVVNAYAYARQWANLRIPRVEVEVEHPEWTDDDELLLTDSMHDLDRELV